MNLIENFSFIHRLSKHITGEKYAGVSQPFCVHLGQMSHCYVHARLLRLIGLMDEFVVFKQKSKFWVILFYWNVLKFDLEQIHKDYSVEF